MIVEDEDGFSVFWFQFDIFMYMGLGVYDDISLLQEDEDDLLLKKDFEIGQINFLKLILVLVLIWLLVLLLILEVLLQ